MALIRKTSSKSTANKKDSPKAKNKLPLSPKPLGLKKPTTLKAPLVIKKPTSPKAPLVIKKPTSPKAPLVLKKPTSPKAPLVIKKPTSPKAPLVLKKPTSPKAPLVINKSVTPKVSPTTALLLNKSATSKTPTSKLPPPVISSLISKKFTPESTSFTKGSLADVGTKTLSKQLETVEKTGIQTAATLAGKQVGLDKQSSLAALELQQTYEQATGSKYSLSSTFNSAKTYVYNTMVAIPALFVALFTALKNGNATAWTGVVLVVIITLGILYFTDKLPGFSSKSFTLVNVNNQVKAVSSQLTTLNNGMTLLSNFSQRTKEFFTDMDTKVDPSALSLVDIQPQTVKQVGYLGPQPEGMFGVQDATSQALLSGIRSFIFQIDYLDKSLGSEYAAPGIPCLVYRADDGSLVSKNSADIYKVTEIISNLAFRPESPNYAAPVIIYLHILRAPSALKAPDEYKEFLSRIAIAMKPLAPQHLGMTPLGVFNRQKQEDVLVTTPLKTFEGQVIVLCNADTSVFRKGPRIDPADDLDFWVNMRVYLGDPSDTIGITSTPAQGVTPSAVIINAKNVLSMSSSQTDAFALTAKKAFVIAMPSQSANPTTTEMDTLLNKLGVNMVPMDIFSDNIETVKSLVGEYDGMPLRPKPAFLRNNTTKE